MVGLSTTQPVSHSNKPFHQNTCLYSIVLYCIIYTYPSSPLCCVGTLTDTELLYALVRKEAACTWQAGHLDEWTEGLWQISKAEKRGW